MSIANYIFLGLAVFTVLCTVMALLCRKAWWIRVFDFPRLQIIFIQFLAIAGLIVYLPESSWWEWVVFALLLIATAVQLSYIIPYLFIARKTVHNAPVNPLAEVSFCVSNVKMDNRQSKKLISLVEEYQPDIFLAIETDEWWQNELDELESIFSFTVKQPQNDTYGMLLYSKYPLENVAVKHLVKQDIPSIHTTVRIGEFSFNLTCLHPEPPAPQEADSSEPRDKELAIVARQLAKSGSPQIVMGDLNDVAWSDTSNQFGRKSGLLDPRRGRGFFNTFHAKIPMMRWALDHIFVSDHFKVIRLKRLPEVGSDHFPMFFHFGLGEDDK